MKAKYTSQCSACFRDIPAGTEVGYRKGRGIRHLGVCAPISTEELAAGRVRWAESQARIAARKREDDTPYARHDAANEAVYGPAALAQARAERVAGVR